MDPKNKRNSGGGNNNKNLMGIVSIVLWALIIVLMVNYVTSMATTRQSTEIDYSEFVQMVRDDKVAWVVMESNKYTIYPQARRSRPDPVRPAGDGGQPQSRPGGPHAVR